MTFWRAVRVAVLAVAAPVALAACHETPQATFVVSSTVDSADVSPGDGVCETATSGQCTLRAAVMEANSQAPGTETEIHLDAATTYALTIAGSDDAGATGDLDVHADLTLVGNGATIDGLQETRIFEHHVGSLVLRDVTLANGASSQHLSVPDGSSGGGILNHADLRLEGAVIERSLTDLGGSAIHQTAGRTVLVETSVLRSVGGYVGPWAAVHVSAGELVVWRSSISGTQPGPVGSRYLTNEDYQGVHIAAAGTASVVLSSVIQSAAPQAFGSCDCEGDGIRADGSLTVRRSTLINNDLDLTGTGSIDVGGSVLESCGVVVSSSGYSYDADGSCLGAGAPGDMSSPAAVVDESPVPWPPRGFLPLAGAPIVDAIPTGTPGLCDSPVLPDQRGEPQPSGGGCDMGSIERQPGD